MFLFAPRCFWRCAPPLLKLCHFRKIARRTHLLASLEQDTFVNEYRHLTIRV